MAGKANVKTNSTADAIIPLADFGRHPSMGLDADEGYPETSPLQHNATRFKPCRDLSLGSGDAIAHRFMHELDAGVTAPSTDMQRVHSPHDLHEALRRPFRSVLLRRQNVVGRYWTASGSWYYWPCALDYHSNDAIAGRKRLLETDMRSDISSGLARWQNPNLWPPQMRSENLMTRIRERRERLGLQPICLPDFLEFVTVTKLSMCSEWCSISVGCCTYSIGSERPDHRYPPSGTTDTAFRKFMEGTVSLQWSGGVGITKISAGDCVYEAQLTRSFMCYVLTILAEC